MDSDSTSIGNPFTATTDPARLYDSYHRLREQDPVFWSEQTHCWFTFSYPETSVVLSQPRFDKRAYLTRMQQNFGPSVADMLTHMPFFMEPPAHTRTRALLASAFTEQAVGQLRPHIQALVDTLLQPVMEQRSMDMVTDLANPLPLMVISQILGVPESDYPVFAERCRTLSEATDPFAKPEVHQAGARVLETFRAYFLELVAVRRRLPGTALLDAIIQAHDEQHGQLSDEEIVAICINIIFAGSGTTTTLLGNLMGSLLSHPEQWSRLLHNHTLVRPAIEETARYETPVQFFGRGVAEDITLREKYLRKGQLVFAALGAANRDPEVYSDPDRFDITRFTDTSTRPHLAFGRGFRYCLGAQLARLEAEVVLETCLSRFPTLQMVDALPRWQPAPVERKLETLLVTW
ncbi:MAG TPA: cytochrome P450 [Ktedonobacteraceae bacterium]|nr:cytochrome P450 [Ktedonobacteraceae bacterium]